MVNDPQYVQEYQSNIFEHIKLKNFVTPEFHQLDLNDKMRSILVDWIVEVHQKFKLTAETLFTTVYIIDQFCQKVQISKSQFQLLGITALFVACKYQEVQIPKIELFIYVTDNTYSVQELIQMEGMIINTLDF